jgi:hypothetical protein
VSVLLAEVWLQRGGKGGLPQQLIDESTYTKVASRVVRTPDNHPHCVQSDGDDDEVRLHVQLIGRLS